MRNPDAMPAVPAHPGSAAKRDTHSPSFFLKGFMMKRLQSKSGKQSVFAAAGMAMLIALSANSTIALAADTVQAQAGYHTANPTRKDAWNATWNAAYNICRAKYKGIKSVNLLTYQVSDPIGPSLRIFTATWECRKTP
ncbi:hypothetical protein [Ralstonia pseudosolanacearum]|nr:hypothetical protein [Ralstonia pseudosolanacearum]